ncbi:SIR2 family protein [Spongiactinospora sp. TRM90649]|uniref:SIR2 family NAD-dependent protein deacylase n=1 Tax=Spongiactinospora sp. TRM90649 TaxID=3031114 RepID=UPI0023F6D898|nr:SIR2 family protein [Spongiactinospora sp. TRM90649]MDF5752621.1 SIR2 family protein [Spongiactinospora sp. TRM90649]
MNDADWDRLIRQLRRGDCTPLLGAGACNGRLPSGAELSRHFAAQYRYPFADSDNLARVMQYAALVGQDPVELKHEVCAYLRDFAPQSGPGPLDPHTVLSEFPIKTFLTTNYDNFMVQALQQRNKIPAARASTWWDTEADEAMPTEPSEQHPLVYHLHGRWNDPSSLVLTEDDYLTYLVNLVDARALDAGEQLPLPVLSAMTGSPLLFVGYSMQDWNFRLLFHGLIRTLPNSRRRRHVSVQLLPQLDASLANAEDLAHDYLERYLDGWSISIFIGSTQKFFTELLNRM